MLPPQTSSNLILESASNFPNENSSLLSWTGFFFRLAKHRSESSNVPHELVGAKPLYLGHLLHTMINTRFFKA